MSELRQTSLTLSLLLVLACGPAKDPNVYVAADLIQSPRLPHGAPVVRPATKYASATGTASTASDADPEAIAALEKSLLLPPVMMSLSKHPSPVLALAFDGTTRGQVDGLSGDGPTRSVTLGEGEHARVPVSLSPGSCLTVVGHGGLGVVELDLFLMEPAQPSRRLIAQDLVHGPSAILGGKEGCFPAERAMELELYLLARRGAGEVLFQIFRR